MGATPEREAAPGRAPASDESQQALARVESVLALAGRRALTDEECRELVDDLVAVPGRVRAAAQALAREPGAAAVRELRRLPAGTPGVLEGLHRAITRGVRRRFDDQSEAPSLLALDFCSSRARAFADLLLRAAAIFGEDLEALRESGKLRYRAVLVASPRLPQRVRTCGGDLAYLYRRLARLRGTRLWLDGWCFADEDGISEAGRSLLLQAWIDRVGRSPR